jgi:hypothetical protein
MEAIEGRMPRRLRESDMYPYPFTRHDSDARARHVFDIIERESPYGAHSLVLEERASDAALPTAISCAAEVSRRHAHPAWLRWIGGLLVRAGARLQAAPASPSPR